MRWFWIANRFAKQYACIWRTISHSNMKRERLTKLLNFVSHRKNLWQVTCADVEKFPSNPFSHAHSAFRYSSSLNSQTLIPNKRGFKMACLNITSLPRHIDELRIILYSKCLDLLAIKETRLHDIIADNEVSVMISSARSTTKWQKSVEVGFAFIFALILIMSFARTSYLINWKAFLSKLVNQEANLLLLLLGTDLKINLFELFSPRFRVLCWKVRSWRERVLHYGWP